MTRTIIIGIDPGGQHTGIVARDNLDLLDHATVDRQPRESRPDYIDRVLDEAQQLLVTCICELRATVDDKRVLIAVEDVEPPTGFARGAAAGERRPISLAGLVDLAVVAGAVLGRFPGTIVVPVGGNGSQPLPLYPEALRPTRGAGKGRDNLRHARSAWDVAGVARLIARLMARQAARR